MSIFLMSNNVEIYNFNIFSKNKSLLIIEVCEEELMMEDSTC